MLNADGILYIHVPKTGGTSIETLLGSTWSTGRHCFLNLPAHSTIEEYEEIMKENPVATVSSIRNPYDRFFSFWLRYVYTKSCVMQLPILAHGDGYASLSSHDFKRSMTQWFLENYTKLTPASRSSIAIKARAERLINEMDLDMSIRDAVRWPLWDLKFNLRPNLYRHFYTDNYDKIENFILFENLVNDWRSFAEKMYENYRIQINKKLPIRKHRYASETLIHPSQMYYGKEFHNYLSSNYKMITAGNLLPQFNRSEQLQLNEKMMATLAATPQGSLPKIDKINLSTPGGSYEYYSDTSIALFEKYNKEDIEFYFNLVKNRSDLSDNLKKKCLTRPRNTTLERQ